MGSGGEWRRGSLGDRAILWSGLICWQSSFVGRAHWGAGLTQGAIRTQLPYPHCSAQAHITQTLDACSTPAHQLHTLCVVVIRLLLYERLRPILQWLLLVLGHFVPARQQQLSGGRACVGRRSVGAVGGICGQARLDRTRSRRQVQGNPRHTAPSEHTAALLTHSQPHWKLPFPQQHAHKLSLLPHACTSL